MVIALATGRQTPMIYNPHLLSSSSNPCLPSPVCFTPNIAERVPSGKSVAVSGMNVTKVRWLARLVRVKPCVAFLPIIQPSFCRSAISCFPVRDGGLVYLGRCQLRYALNVWSHEGIKVGWRADSRFFGHSIIQLNMVLSKKSLPFANIFEGIQMQYYCFFKPFISFRQRTPKGRCAQILTDSHPSFTFSVECGFQDNICVSCHCVFLLLGLSLRLDSSTRIVDCQYLDLWNISSLIPVYHYYCITDWVWPTNKDQRSSRLDWTNEHKFQGVLEQRGLLVRDSKRSAQALVRI